MDQQFPFSINLRGALFLATVSMVFLVADDNCLLRQF
jgi:hypothetical protein